MRVSRFPLTTLKETPADAEVISHQLMLRAGLIRRVAAGIYVWLPLGLRILRRVEGVVREEMNRAGALEILMPAVQPAELWQESGRWDQYGPELLRLKDRHQRDFCIGPTHEEVITDLIRREIKSYKQLPLNYFQIQTKFRDEIRPRFGIMRAREFLMKDAYSFHPDQGSLQETYDAMYDAYNRVFTRLGLKYRAVLADSGNIGGTTSHEFHVLADAGEDAIAYSSDGDYAANVELAEALTPAGPRPSPSADVAQQVATPGQDTIEQVSRFLDLDLHQVLKTLLVRGANGGTVALCLRGDHELNVIKAEQLPQVAAPLTFASETEIAAATGAKAGSVGPVGLKIPVIADRSAAHMVDFVCGANVPDAHLKGVNWGRDLPEPDLADLRNVTSGDPSPDGRGSLSIARGIEVGHVFQLGKKYSAAMGASVLDDNGDSHLMLMGCYGIGVSRIVAAAIEQNHDARGILWPAAMAPFQVALVPIKLHKSGRLREVVYGLYERLSGAGMEVLLDDRDARPGVMFADMDLIGIPHRIVISERGLDAGHLEYKYRGEADSVIVPADEILEFLQQRITGS